MKGRHLDMTEVRPSTRLPPPCRPGPRPPVERLASLKHPIPIPIQRPQPQPKPTTHPKTAACPNPSCPAPNIVEDDGQKVCSGCGTVVSDANIVSEITFGESSSGAAIVQGTFVGADQSHGRSFGPGFIGTPLASISPVHEPCCAAAPGAVAAVATAIAAAISTAARFPTGRRW